MKINVTAYTADGRTAVVKMPLARDRHTEVIFRLMEGGSEQGRQTIELTDRDGIVLVYQREDD